MSLSSEDDEKLLSEDGQSLISSLSGASGDGDDNDDDDDDDDAGDGVDHNGNGGRGRDFRPPPQHNFAPPFYGRPPTPLPPSPSLTSLLRPSRPTTPDASDDEHHLEPVPRASPRVPTYEYYGFVLYLFSSLTFLIYLLWSYLPSPFLHALGIYYYPNRWWSLAIPSFLVMALVYTYVALASYNAEILTLPLDSIETIVDEAAMIAAVVDFPAVAVGVGGSGGDGSSGSGGRSRHGTRRRSVRGGGGDNDGDGGAGGPAVTRSGGSRRTRTRRRTGTGTGTGTGTETGTATATATTTMEGRDGKDGGGGAAARGWKRVGKEVVESRSGRIDWKRMWNEGTDAVMDVPLAGVCEVLYGDS